MKRSVTIDVAPGPALKRARTLPSRSYRRARSSVASQIKRILNKRVEVKYHDTVTSGALYTSNVNCINQVAEGIDNSQRIGKHVTAKYLMMDIAIMPSTVANASNALNADFGILGVAIDRQPNGALPNFNQIWTGPVSQPFRNTNDMKRFKVLKLENYYVQPKFDPAGLLTTPNFQAPLKFRWYIPLKELDIEYSSTGATIPSTNSLLFFVGSNLGTNGAQWNYTTRFAFTDM